MPMEWINDRGMDKDGGGGCVYIYIYIYIYIKKEIGSNRDGPREYHSE